MCKGLVGPRSKDTIAGFKQVFIEYGLPDAIRTDNGQPFAGLGIGALTTLSIWWLKLGIMPERIELGHPEQNGRHERMHRTLKEAVASPPKDNFVEQQRIFDDFRACLQFIPDAYVPRLVRGIQEMVKLQLSQFNCSFN